MPGISSLSGILKNLTGKKSKPTTTKVANNQKGTSRDKKTQLQNNNPFGVEESDEELFVGPSGLNPSESASLRSEPEPKEKKKSNSFLQMARLTNLKDKSPTTAGPLAESSELKLTKEEEDDDDEDVDDPEDDEENEDDFFQLEEVDVNSSKVSFACLSPEQISIQQEHDIKEVSEILNIPHFVAGTFLRHFQWNQEKLLEKYMANPAAVCKQAGVPLKDVQLSNNNNDLKNESPEKAQANEILSRAIELFGEEECPICLDDVEAEHCTALQCRHRFCNTCWEQELQIKIREGQATRIKCPKTGCNMVVDELTLKKLVPKQVYERYTTFIAKSYVEDSEGRVKWCPMPDCGNAITADMIEGTQVQCTCGHRFCFSCHREAHLPATCEQVTEWEKKCEDDSETKHWKYANTKDCPNKKCNIATEKNGGCNHMVCVKCKHEWCWVCLRPWKGHNDYYNCNKFIKNLDSTNKKKTSVFNLFTKSSRQEKAREREMERERQRLALERYLHYYERFKNHSHSRELEKQVRTKIQMKVAEFKDDITSTSAVQYLLDGTEELLACRQVLKYTYVVAFLMAEDEQARNLFEYLQKNLEVTTESLSEILETATPDPEHRKKTLHLIELSKTKRDNLLRAIEQGLIVEGN